MTVFDLILPVMRMTIEMYIKTGAKNAKTLSQEINFPKKSENKYYGL